MKLASLQAPAFTATAMTPSHPLPHHAVPTLAARAPAALRRFRYFASTDVDETRERIAAVMQPHTLVPRDAAPIRAHMDLLRFGRSAIGTIKFGAMDIDVGRIADYHLVLMCTSGHGSVWLDGEEVEVGGRHAAVGRPGARFSARFSADCEQLVLRVPTAALQAHTGAQALAPGPRLDLTAPTLRPWLRQMELLVTDEATSRLAATHARIGLEFERLLVELLLAHTQADAAWTLDATASPAPAAVRRAEAFMEANAARALQLDDIAQAAGTPVRTLLTNFRHFRGTSPMQWLRDLRLDRARARLSMPNDDDSVTAVATDVGFGHLGRFSQAYAARFHESPSQTLRAARERRLYTPR